MGLREVEKERQGGDETRRQKTKRGTRGKKEHKMRGYKKRVEEKIGSRQRGEWTKKRERKERKR